MTYIRGELIRLRLSTWISRVPFVCNFRSFLSSYTFIHAYLRERARTCMWHHYHISSQIRDKWVSRCVSRWARKKKLSKKVDVSLFSDRWHLFDRIFQETRERSCIRIYVSYVWTIISLLFSRHLRRDGDVALPVREGELEVSIMTWQRANIS